jgi:hypothetical protein
MRFDLRPKITRQLRQPSRSATGSWRIRPRQTTNAPRFDAAAGLCRLPDDTPELRDAEYNLLVILATWPVSTVARPIEGHCPRRGRA